MNKIIYDYMLLEDNNEIKFGYNDELQTLSFVLNLYKLSVKTILSIYCVVFGGLDQIFWFIP